MTDAAMVALEYNRVLDEINGENERLRAAMKQAIQVLLFMPIDGLMSHEARQAQVEMRRKCCEAVIAVAKTIQVEGA